MNNEAKDIVDSLSGHPISLYIHGSGATLLLIDWLSTLDVEVAHVWHGLGNTGKILYFLTRYSPFLDTPIWLHYNVASSIPPPLCARLYITCSAISIFGVIVAELILTIRVWALWGRHRGVGSLLLIMAVANIVASIVMFSMFCAQLRYFTIPNLPGCFSVPTGQGSLHSWAFIPLVVHQTVIFSLTATKGIQHYREGFYGTSLMNTFYRDGVTYYALLIAFSMANLASHQRSDLTVLYFLTFLQQIVHSIISSRMLLHLREETDTYHDSKPLTALQFVPVEHSTDVQSSIPTTQLSEERSVSGGH